MTALLNSLLWRLLDHGNGAGMVSNGISLTWNIIVVLLMLRGLTLLCPAEPRFRTTRRWWAAASASLLLTSLLTLLAWRGSFSRLAVDLIGRGNGVGYLLQAAYFFCFCGAMEVLLKKRARPEPGHGAACVPWRSVSRLSKAFSSWRTCPGGGPKGNGDWRRAHRSERRYYALLSWQQRE